MGAGANPRGPWLSGSNYLLGDVVSDSGTSYILMVDELLSTTNPQNDLQHWALFAAAGLSGVSGVSGISGASGVSGVSGVSGCMGAGVNPRGPWMSGAVYSLADVVAYNGSSFILTATSLVSTVTPDVDTANWSRFADGGPPGANGASGVSGVSGFQVSAELPDLAELRVLVASLESVANLELVEFLGLAASLVFKGSGHIRSKWCVGSFRCQRRIRF